MKRFCLALWTEVRLNDFQNPDIVDLRALEGTSFREMTLTAKQQPRSSLL